MLTTSPARLLSVALALALSLAVLVAALLAPSQTLAQTHRPTCSTSAAQSKTKGTVHACAQSSHKGKGRSHAHHATKRHAEHGGAKHPLVKKSPKTAPPAPPAPPAASCEDGSAPVRANDGSFSCKDGSEPACEDSSNPTRSSSDTSLVCPVSSEGGSGSSEAECEEGLGSTCSAGTDFSSAEHACEASSSDGSSFVCEDRS